MNEVNELDFTIEFNAEGLDEATEGELFAEAEDRLLALTKGHDDLTGSAINLRRPARDASSHIWEATVVLYSRPEHVSATKKDERPVIALKGALSAAERQVRDRRAKLRKHWERPEGDPVIDEMREVVAAELEAETEAEED